jgi:hypothetical protein
MPPVPAIDNTPLTNPVPGPSIKENSGPAHYIWREVDDGLAVGPEGGICESGVNTGLVRRLHSIILMIG